MTEILFVPDLLTGLTLTASPKGLAGITFGQATETTHGGPLLKQVELQLREYLSGTRRSFDIPLDPQGSPFQLQVWRALMDIPYGRTCSYKDVAHAVNRPRGFQAIGQANHRNPIPIVIPCHRVIAADRSIGGYGGGLDLKRRLLALEARRAFL